jgi:hypothetical protein
MKRFRGSVPTFAALLLATVSYAAAVKPGDEIDSEGWLITASDQHDKEGKLWKTMATFNRYRDRPTPDARVAIYPFKRMFQTALVDEDVQDDFSTLVCMPSRETQERECWYINLGIVTKGFLNPHQLAMHAP